MPTPKRTPSKASKGFRHEKDPMEASMSSRTSVTISMHDSIDSIDDEIFHGIANRNHHESVTKTSRRDDAKDLINSAIEISVLTDEENQKRAALLLNTESSSSSIFKDSKRQPKSKRYDSNHSRSRRKENSSSRSQRSRVNDQLSSKLSSHSRSYHSSPAKLNESAHSKRSLRSHNQNPDILQWQLREEEKHRNAKFSGARRVRRDNKPNISTVAYIFSEGNISQPTVQKEEKKGEDSMELSTAMLQHLHTSSKRVVIRKRFDGTRYTVQSNEHKRQSNDSRNRKLKIDSCLDRQMELLSPRASLDI